MDCRQHAPALIVIIGAITFTSCARQAILTRSACFSSVMSIQPTTSASSIV